MSTNTLLLIGLGIVIWYVVTHQPSVSAPTSQPPSGDFDKVMPGGYKAVHAPLPGPGDMPVPPGIVPQPIVPSISQPPRFM